MTFPILGGNGAVAGYEIDNSLRFNDNDSARLTRTPSSSSNRKTFSISCWFKRGNISLSDSIDLYSAGQSSGGTGSFSMHILAGNSLRLDANGVVVLNTNRLFRDVGAWYHYLLVVDTTQATASNRFKIYINGAEETSFATDNRSSISQNTDLRWNMNEGHGIGFNFYDTTYYYDGYIAEFYNIDGTAKSPTDFGEFDSDSGIWKPIEYTGSYGTNGFYLDFSNSSTLGEDFSGNDNDFTPTNLASTDQTTDTPTNNFATLNPLDRAVENASGGITLSEGNCKSVGVNGGNRSRAQSTIGFSSGKWYAEFKIVNGNDHKTQLGVIDEVQSTTNHGGVNAGVEYRTNDDVIYSFTNGSENSNQTGLSGISNNDIVGIAVNADTSPPSIQFYVNGSTQGSAVTYPNTGSIYFFFVRDGSDSGNDEPEVLCNFGNPPFSISSGNSDGNGHGNFEYAPPSGYLALCTQNLATALSPTIDDGSQYFNTVLYTGTGADGKAVTGVGFQPDWLWIKKRSGSGTHVLSDSTRGANKQLFSNLTDAEQTSTDFVASFDSDGFTVNDSAVGTGDVNYTSGGTYVAWNWLANGGTTSSNTDGSITSTVQANTTAGFSIVTYTGTGSAGTIGHGLGKTPKMIIVKNRDGAYQWLTYHAGMTNDETSYIELNSTVAQQSGETHWNSTAPTSSVFSCLTQLSINNSGDNYLAYCFAEIEGYSKFGSYTGNGSTDGTFVYTGFKPALMIIKRTDTADNWQIQDIKRHGSNGENSRLQPNDSSAEATNSTWTSMDFLSNGFKQRYTDSIMNASGGTYIYMAFAENPFVTSSGVPVVAL